MSVGGDFPRKVNPMKGYKDSTKMRGGFDFTRTTTPVKPHTRAIPQKKMAEAAPMKKAEGGVVKRPC